MSKLKDKLAELRDLLMLDSLVKSESDDLARDVGQKKREYKEKPKKTTEEKIKALKLKYKDHVEPSLDSQVRSMKEKYGNISGSDKADLNKARDLPSDLLEVDEKTKNFLDHFAPSTKHPLEPTSGMPVSNKKGERRTKSGFKLKAVSKDVKKEDLKMSCGEYLDIFKNGQWTLNKAQIARGFFSPEHLHQIDKAGSHEEAKKIAHSIVDAHEGARPENIKKVRLMIDSSKSKKHLLISAANFMLAHPSEMLGVGLKKEDKKES